MKISKKNKVILIISFIVLIIGTLIPLLYFYTHNNKDISGYCIDQGHQLLPKLYKLISLQNFQIKSNQSVVVEARTLFNITLQRIYFDSINACIEGATNKIVY